MTTDDHNNRISKITSTLKELPNKEFFTAATDLLRALGYESDRIPDGQSAAVSGFIRQYPAPTPNTKTEQSFAENAESIRILFQFTEHEITTQIPLFDAASFDKGNARSFLFVAVELKAGNYSRGNYASFAREINKRWQIPTVVLFKTSADLLTLAFVHRREHKRNPDRDVLGSVSLIREINPADAHRAHSDILAELSIDERLEWMDAHSKDHNFDGLMTAWLDALDTRELNRRFYGDLYRWFERASVECRFPTDTKSQPVQEQVIRLITRLLFIWFIKEKGLVAPGLFIENRVAELLKNYDSNSGDSYYRAILQNLFFATLNTKIEDRRFSKRSQADHRNFSVYRYRKEIAEPDTLQNLFDQTPFINGGLFDCLDTFESAGDDGVRIDYFTDNVVRKRTKEYGKLSIPNRLFFDERGLITLFNRYKFTVEENTPTEQEVALDPELLGKVFENLLASVIPETQLTARKQTGSYYTPRDVVDYMVDEALTASLAQMVSPENGDKDSWQNRLHNLLDYSYAFADAEAPFTESEREGIISAIANLKILDPAVGSGAFPMSILHKLTLALRRLDADNRRWEDLQRGIAGGRAERTFGTASGTEREDQLTEISRTFDKYRDSDYGRKLYLIQNTICGVDIQPVATQIAKLRFFISLAIEQQPTKDRSDNYGIQPLPNLETRFVAADTLLGLEQPAQRSLAETDAVKELRQKLHDNREAHFHANSRREKMACRNEDRRLRQELADTLKNLGDLPAEDADRVAQWNPYDQNAEAKWFDPDYMFGITDGFDVVIGNPPYVEARNSLLSDDDKNAYQQQVMSDWGESLPRGSDLLIYFLARSPKLLSGRGRGCLITQNAWLSTDYGKRFQDFSLGKFSVQKIVDTSAKFFSDPDGPQINAVVVIFSRDLLKEVKYEIVNNRMERTDSKTFAAGHPMKWGHLATMPDFFVDMLYEMTLHESSSGSVTFGQGLNFPLKELNQRDSKYPVIVKDVHFVATSTDGEIGGSRVSLNRRNRIPALIMPRGVGDRYYCTFNACKAFSYSGVELYLPQQLWYSDLHYCLWAYLNSSLAWLFRETTGRRNLGGGLLKVEASDMKVLPIRFDFNFADEAKSVFETLRMRDPLPVAKEIRTNEHLALDQMVFDFFGFPNMQEATREHLLNLVEFRTRRSSR